MGGCERHRRGTDMYLNVCTVLLIMVPQVQGGENLALLKPTSAYISTDPNTGPEHAVDGLAISTMDVDAGQYCSFVDYLGTVWWQVDLLATVWVSHVVITPASYAYGRPNDFQLQVLPDPRCSSTPQTCLNYTGILPTGNTTLYCTTPLRGRIVRLSQIDPLFLCEFAVYKASSSKTSMYFTKSIGKRREIASPLEQEVKSVVDCGRYCVQEGWTYFNYKQQEGLCQLPSESNHSDVITSDSDWGYYEEDPCNV